MDQKLEYITFIVVISTLLAAFLLFIIIDLVLMYRNRKKMLEERLEFEKQKFEQIIERQENQNLQAILDALENERKRIAADIHDRIGSGISTAKLYFEGIQRLVQTNDEKTQENFEKVTSLLEHSISEVRKVSHNIISGSLADFGLITALQDLKESINASKKLTLHFTHDGFNERVEKDIEINLYRVIQELINNTIKHANASEIKLDLKLEKNQLHLSYSDNGKGIKEKIKDPGIGINNIQLRIKNLLGQCETLNQVEGYHFKATIPLNKKEL